MSHKTQVDLRMTSTRTLLPLDTLRLMLPEMAIYVVSGEGVSPETT